ncbi:MAG: hypothetical protein HY865_07015 [Chloroflexi bacterium]|nr:hypothetical protein [Chloroflexota bacterium]
MLVLFVIYKWFWGVAPFPYVRFLLVILLGYAFVVTFQFTPKQHVLTWWAHLGILILGSIALQASGHLELFGYGDHGELATLMMKGEVFPRWLGGSAVLLYGYRIWQMIPGLNQYAKDVDSVLMFTRVAGGIVMLLFSAAALYKRLDRTSVMLALSSPVYLMLSTAYDEYYPYVAGMFLFFLLIVVETDSFRQNVRSLGFLLAILPIFYAPFIVTSLIVLAYYLLFESTKRLELVFAFLSSYILLVFLFWNSERGDYVSNLVSTINTGNHRLLFGRYWDQAASASIFFKPQNAATWKHFGDLSYMLLWSGSMIPAILLGMGVYRLATNKVFMKFITSSRTPLLVILFAWQLFYFVFMLPRLGPKTDIDLFFSFYICLAFTAGYVWDYIKKRESFSDRINDMIVPTVAANTVVTLFFLLRAGIPDIF